MSPEDRQLFDDQDRLDDRNRFDDRNRADDRGMSEDRAFDDRGISEDRAFDDRNRFDDWNRFADRNHVDDRGLELQLTDAGRQARLSAGGSRPDPIFAAELRERLVASLESDRARFPWPFGFMQRTARLVPVSAAALLFAAAVVGASQLHLGAPDPTPPPAASTHEPDASSGPGPTGFPEGTDNLGPIIPVATSTPAATPVPPTPTPPPAPPAPTPPLPTPTPTPSMPSLALSLKSCDGGVVIKWSKYIGADFNHYTTLRNTVNNIPLAYPPQGGAVDFGGTYSTDFTKVSAVDATGVPVTTYYYRAMAFNSSDQVIGASAIGSAQANPVASLDPLVVAPEGADTRFTWNTYTGPAGCFTYYKIVWSTDPDQDPNYLDGDPYVWAGSNQTEFTTVIPGLTSGGTWFRIQALRFTDLGVFVAAQSDPTYYIVP